MPLSKSDLNMLSNRLPIDATKIFLENYCHQHKIDPMSLGIDFAEHPSTIQNLRKESADKKLAEHIRNKKTMKNRKRRERKKKAKTLLMCKPNEDDIKIDDNDIKIDETELEIIVEGTQTSIIGASADLSSIPCGATQFAKGVLSSLPSSSVV